MMRMSGPFWQLPIDKTKNMKTLVLRKPRNCVSNRLCRTYSLLLGVRRVELRHGLPDLLDVSLRVVPADVLEPGDALVEELHQVR